MRRRWSQTMIRSTMFRIGQNQEIHIKFSIFLVSLYTIEDVLTVFNNSCSFNDLLQNTKKKTREDVRSSKDLTCENVRLNKNNRPRLRSSFQLRTDASSSSISAVLYQTQYKCKGAIAYTSRILSKFEKIYSIY